MIKTQLIAKRTWICGIIPGILVWDDHYGTFLEWGLVQVEPQQPTSIPSILWHRNDPAPPRFICLFVILLFLKVIPIILRYHICQAWTTIWSPKDPTWVGHVQSKNLPTVLSLWSLLPSSVFTIFNIDCPRTLYLILLNRNHSAIKHTKSLIMLALKWGYSTNSPL